jgi:hypothetical protein
LTPPGSVTVVDPPDPVLVGVVLPPVVPAPGVPAPFPLPAMPPGLAEPVPVPVVRPPGVRVEFDFGESFVPDLLFAGDEGVPAIGVFEGALFEIDVECPGFTGLTT